MEQDCVHILVINDWAFDSFFSFPLYKRNFSSHVAFFSEPLNSSLLALSSDKFSPIRENNKYTSYSSWTLSIFAGPEVCPTLSNNLWSPGIHKCFGSKSASIKALLLWSCGSITFKRSPIQCLTSYFFLFCRKVCIAWIMQQKSNFPVLQ